MAKQSKKRPGAPLPKSLDTLAEEQRAANSMERALSGPTIEDSEQYRLRQEAQRQYITQRYRKAGSYTLAEKYNLLDIFPPTITATKPV